MDIDVDDSNIEISDHQVLQSNVGYYVGTLYFDSEMNEWFPDLRISHYFKSKKEAQKHLDYLQQTWSQIDEYNK
jgi:Uri superfamily endonuclease